MNDLGCAWLGWFCSAPWVFHLLLGTSREQESDFNHASTFQGLLSPACDIPLAKADHMTQVQSQGQS